VVVVNTVQSRPQIAKITDMKNILQKRPGKRVAVQNNKWKKLKKSNSFSILKTNIKNKSLYIQFSSLQILCFSRRHHQVILLSLSSIKQLATQVNQPAERESIAEMIFCVPSLHYHFLFCHHRSLAIGSGHLPLN